ncbi:MAG TPA: hypothetical protein VMS71_03995, partial [Candidatus Acidoferrum sp.]|nr:hypothetical protein [Candidatus Acidoferrum sp.]
MNISLAYGSSSVTIEVPPNVCVDSFMASAVEHPIAYPEFEAAFNPDCRSWCESVERVLVVVNDAYRHTPTAVV